MKKSFLIKLIVVAAIIGICLYIFSPRQPAFSLISSTPTNKSTKTNPEGTLEFTFSSPLDPESPYDSFSISPKVEGKVKLTNEKLSFIPSNGFNDSTKYTVFIKQVRSINGSTTTITDFSFTTFARKKAAFEDFLPYDGGDFTVDRLGNGTIVLTIINPPAAANKEKALAFLRSKKINIDNVQTQIATSAQ